MTSTLFSPIRLGDVTLQNRIAIFVNLPISALDRLSLQSRLDAIGKTQESDGNVA